MDRAEMITWMKNNLHLTVDEIMTVGDSRTIKVAVSITDDDGEIIEIASDTIEI